ncbi:MAG TPA: PAS domain S-box protein [Opitutaceae bacterium]|nr:PAS domain S-box protein [Opitutaceae bacterium]
MNTSRQPAGTSPAARRLEAFPAGAPRRSELVGQIAWAEVLDAVSDPILVHDAESGRILTANAAACRFFGYDAPTLLQLNIAALGDGNPPHGLEDLRRRAALARAEGTQVFDWLARASDGRRFWVEAALCAGQGVAAGRAYLTLRDISLRKSLAAEHARDDAELRRSEERFRLLLGRVPTVAVQGIGADGLVCYWNEASERFYGYTAAEALGRPLLALIVPSALQAEMHVALHQMIATGQPLPPAETQLQRKDGRMISVLSSYTVLNLPGGTPEIYRLDFDLSERKQAEAERLELERRLLHSQNLESLGVLAGGVAHDFNNLLTGVLGNLELARTELAADSTTRPLLDDAIAATRLAGCLTQQLLAYAGHSRPQHRSVDLSTIVEEHAAVLATATAGRATLQLDLARDLPEAEADRAHIAQMLVNLVTNAAEAISGGGTVEVRTGIEEDCTAERLAESRLLEKPPPQTFVFLEVADTGCGMPAAMAKRIFDPFFSTKFTGRGLGLPVVFGIVRAHRGALFIDSQAGRGCVVRVLLPLARRPIAAPPEAIAEPALRGTLLVVDDEESIRRIAQRMGHRLGLDVITAIDAESAAAIARLHAGGLLCAIVDFTMPGVSGLECLQMLREIQPGIPAVISSGCLPPELADHAAAGFDSVLPKPFTFDQFAEAVQVASRRAST